MYKLLLPLIVLAACSNPKPLTSFVDPFIGTGGHGHTFPGATRPFAMVQLSPDTRLTGWDGCSGYHYTDSIIYGFSHTHLSGTGISDYGDILLMPYSGETYFNNGADGEKGYSSFFKKSLEKASPGYYEVFLEDHQVKVELASTDRVGIHNYTFENIENRKIMIDLDHRDLVTSSALVQVNEFELSGHRHSSGWAADQRVFFNIQFDQPILNIKWKTDEEKGIKAALDFGAGDAELKVKVAISSVDEEGAKRNLEAEIPDWNFEKVKMDSEGIWKKQLSKIMVEGGTETQKRVFYTSLYHTMIAPNLFMDVDGRYLGTDLKIHQAENHTNYTIFSLWDTFRSTHPLYTLIERERTNDFINTFLAQYQQGGQLPVWELAGNYTGTMIGYNAVPVITDAYVKGIQDFDAELALEAMQHSAMQDKLGIDYFRNNGYISAGQEAESVSKTLEYAYDDWTIAVMADSIHRHDISDEYYQRAQHYRNIFDPSSGFMRARNNNQWFAPFKPEEVNFHYTEANAWQYSYFVPQDVVGWMELLGGASEAEKKLDSLFAANSATSGRDQADITGLIGQYAQGNEPSHHIPYLYNFTGAAYKTQRIVRQIMTELYTDKPDGLSGNEDCGQMSSWLVFSAMGFYPVTPGSTDYIIGSPWFDSITLNLENGFQFVINVKNQSKENVYVQSISLNSEHYPYSYLSHEDIMAGGAIDFELGSSPNKAFGKSEEHRPKSQIEVEELIAIPAVLEGERAFQESTSITLNCASKDVGIFYSFSEELSNPVKYISPIELTKSAMIYTWAEKNGRKSLVGKSEFLRIPELRKINLATKYANHYTAGGDLALVDFQLGGVDFRAGGWQGYEGVDIVATVELEAPKEINELGIRMLQDENAWIFMPLEVEFFISSDGENFESVGVAKSDISYKEKGTITKTFAINKKVTAGYIRVIAKNRGVCPPDHKGAGGMCWIFADEIIIN